MFPRMHCFLGEELANVIGKLARNFAAKVAYSIHEQFFAIGKGQRERIHHRGADGIATQPMTLRYVAEIEMNVSRLDRQIRWGLPAHGASLA